MPPDPAPAAAAPVAPAPDPSPAPAPTPDTTPASPTPDSSFENLGSADDLDFVEVPEEPVAEPPAPAVEEQPAVAAPPAPTPAPAPQPPPQAAQPAQEQPAAPAPAQGSQPDDSPQGLVQQLEQHRAAVLDALAADRFKLSPEEISALDTDATAAIPRIMSRVYYEAMQSTLLHLQNQVPRMVLSVLNAQNSSTKAEDKFYGQFKNLDRSKHHNDVLAFATMLRQTNPKISEADLFAMVGAAVMAKNGIAPTLAPNGGTPPRPPSPAPFVPATPGSSVRLVPEAPSPWAGLGQDFDE